MSLWSNARVCVCVCVFQGKTVVQAEIDAAAELIDFFRFNAKHAVELQHQQPLDGDGSTNTMLYRGLEVRGHPSHPPTTSRLLLTLLSAPPGFRCRGGAF